MSFASLEMILSQLDSVLTQYMQYTNAKPFNWDYNLLAAFITIQVSYSIFQSD